MVGWDHKGKETDKCGSKRNTGRGDGWIEVERRGGRMLQCLHLTAE